MAEQDRADQEQGRPRPVGQRDGGGGELLDRLGPQIDEQVARQRGERVAQRLAAMAARLEAELLLQRRELAAKHRHLLDRHGQRLAGPQAGMDADAGDLAFLAQRHDDEVERHPAMDRRAQIGLGHERLLAALDEIADRALAAALVGRIVGELHDAEPPGRLLARPLDLVAEQGHRAVGEPVEQRLALVVGDRVGLGVHIGLHRAPVGDRGADVIEHLAQFGDQLGAGLRVGAVDLDIHEQFAPAPVLAERLDRGQDALFVAGDADHRVKQAMDDEAARGDRLADRIDQEGHVVIGDADPHPPVAEAGARRFEPDQRAAGRPAAGAGGEEGGGGAAILGAEIVQLSGQGAAAQGGARDCPTGAGERLPPLPCCPLS